MSELITAATASRDIRWRLLSSVAACGLLAVVTIASASATEEERPIVWIELGGQLQRLQNSQEPFHPSFLNIQPRPNYEVISPDTVQRLPRYEIAGEGKISFMPRGLATIRFITLS